jgi:uncharacterized phage-associated protein
MSKIKFKFNKQKAIETILYLAQKRHFIDKMSLYKFLFFADEIHLNKYGRIICGGKYVAMPLGPVPSEIKDLIEKEKHTDFDIKDYWITPNREPNIDYLSKSDIEAINQAYGEYSQYEPKELSDISHKHKAWINARNKNKFVNNNKIDYIDLICADNQELIEDLEENSQYILI